MTKKEFTEEIAKGGYGVWTFAAKYAIEKGDYDTYINEWLEQNNDEGSRPTVQKMLGEKLYVVLCSFN